MPYIIGLTGGIAAGKSVVADMLVHLGADVVDADAVSRDLVAPGQPLLDRMVAAWGRGILREDGALDRAALASMVFGRPEEVARLNGITHPAIMEEMERRIDASEAEVAIMMAPLLIEAGGADDVDEVWVVSASPEMRAERVVARDASTGEAARARIAAQLGEEERLRRADVVIWNEGSLDALRDQVEARWAEALQRARRTGRGDRH